MVLFKTHYGDGVQMSINVLCSVHIYTMHIYTIHFIQYILLLCLPVHHEELGSIVDLAPFSYAGCIHEAIGVVAPAQHRVHGVPSGASHSGDDGAVLA